MRKRPLRAATSIFTMPRNAAPIARNASRSSSYSRQSESLSLTNVQRLPCKTIPLSSWVSAFRSSGKYEKSHFKRYPLQLTSVIPPKFSRQEMDSGKKSEAEEEDDRSSGYTSSSSGRKSLLTDIID